MPASASGAARSAMSPSTPAESSSSSVGWASSSSGASSGATRTAWPRPVNSCSTGSPPSSPGRWSPAHAMVAGTIRLGSSVACNNSSTRHGSTGSAGSWIRRHSRVGPTVGSPVRAQSTTCAASAATSLAGSDAGNHGSCVVSEPSHASVAVRRPRRADTSSTPARTSRRRASRSTSSCSASATAARAGPSSASSPPISARSSAEGSGHHHERALPCPSTLSPGTTRPAETNRSATGRHRSRRSASTIASCLMADAGSAHHRRRRAGAILPAPDEMARATTTSERPARGAGMPISAVRFPSGSPPSPLTSRSRRSHGRGGCHGMGRSGTERTDRRPKPRLPSSRSPALSSVEVQTR